VADRKINKMESRLGAYRQSRDELLSKIVTDLSADERFVAAWLTGSYAGNEADAMSDLDLNLVVADPYSEYLCARQAQVSHQTSEARLAIFRTFGEPALIHENNNNAPEGGTFTFVLYSNSALMIDWTLLPQRNAERPFQSLLLFDKGELHVSAPPAPEDLEASRKIVAEQWAFFWMMAAITIKYIVRQDDVFVIHWLEHLSGLVQEIERRINREPWKYIRGSLSQAQTTRKKQLESIRQLCKRMQELKPNLVEFTGTELSMPVTEIEALLSLVNH
jgi:predicted nucleotidyltransferase